MCVKCPCCRYCLVNTRLCSKGSLLEVLRFKPDLAVSKASASQLYSYTNPRYGWGDGPSSMLRITVISVFPSYIKFYSNPSILLSHRMT